MTRHRGRAASDDGSTSYSEADSHPSKKQKLIPADTESESDDMDRIINSDEEQ